MALLEKPIEQPWAFAFRKGFTGDASGLFFRYFATRTEAEKVRGRSIRNGKYAGEIENRPGESWHAGTI